jgi:hypothetical protein
MEETRVYLVIDLIVIVALVCAGIAWLRFWIHH